MESQSIFFRSCIVLAAVAARTASQELR